jgi:hypothetical protein
MSPAAGIITNGKRSTAREDKRKGEQFVLDSGRTKGLQVEPSFSYFLNLLTIVGF